MIIDHLGQVHWYLSINDRVAAALRFLQKTDLEAMSVGRHKIDGARIFAMVQEYTTKPESEGFWEAHRSYIDVQMVVRGRERIGWGYRPEMAVEKHDEEKDLWVLKGSGSFVDVPAGYFMILTPHDAHMPGIHSGEPMAVKKIVVKVLVADD